MRFTIAFLAASILAAAAISAGLSLAFPVVAVVAGGVVSDGTGNPSTPKRKSPHAAGFVFVCLFCGC